jgi:hypothetical protein
MQEISNACVENFIKLFANLFMERIEHPIVEDHYPAGNGYDAQYGGSYCLKNPQIRIKPFVRMRQISAEGNRFTGRRWKSLRRIAGS